jgi:hypothetical protein
MNNQAFFKADHRPLVVRAMLMVIPLLLPLLSSSSAAHAQLSGDTPPGRLPLHGHLLSLLNHRQPLHGETASRLLQLSIALQLRNEISLDALLRAQSDPHSPLYQRYLTPQQFTRLFGPAPASVNRVVAYLRSQGLRIESIAPNRTLITVAGTVAQVERAFAVTIADYQLDGRTVYAPTAEPSVPASLGGLILAIAGLDNVAHYHPLGLRALTNARTAQSGPGGYTPGELRTAYHISPLIDAGANGAGQTVALFELDGYQASDVDTYLQQYALGPARYSNVLVDGATTAPGEGAIEVELDMEVIAAIAPGASQKVYIGPNSTVGVNDTYNRIVTDNLARVVSISWGECEVAAGSAELAALDNIFKQGAAQGQVFFAASGDSGAYDCDDNSLAVDSPADDPNVVGVGGTTLKTDNGGVYVSESAWSNPNDIRRSPKGEGGGGGISSYFPRPTYQSGPNLTASGRMVPDVSADADPATGYSIYCSVAAAGCSGWLTVGGTSAAAPLWAGLVSDGNQYLAAQSKAPLGSLPATLYRLYNSSQAYSIYHDITSGNNLYYQAGSGYDLASGIGSPDGWNFARAVAAQAGGGGGGGGGGSGTTTQLLGNPGFENGVAPWQESSAGGYQIIDTTNPHSGSYSAYLCGYDNCHDRLWQSVALPSTATRVVLSYWLSISTQELDGSCYDFFYANIRSSSGTLITTVQTRCNANAADWQHYSFDLTTVLKSSSGKTIQVSFEATTDEGLATAFFVDDVALNVVHT